MWWSVYQHIGRVTCLRELRRFDNPATKIVTAQNQDRICLLRPVILY